ncbi:unknown [Dialister sp. CAG:486]|nr:unknown [Dialister sp. CAG:486]
MIFVMRSTPLWSPSPQTRNPPTTVIAMKKPISHGLASIAPKTSPTPSTFAEAKVPLTNFQK